MNGYQNFPKGTIVAKETTIIRVPDGCSESIIEKFKEECLLQEPSILNKDFSGGQTSTYNSGYNKNPSSVPVRLHKEKQCGPNVNQIVNANLSLDLCFTSTPYCENGTQNNMDNGFQYFDQPEQKNYESLWQQNGGKPLVPDYRQTAPQNCFQPGLQDCRQPMSQNYVQPCLQDYRQPEPEPQNYEQPVSQPVPQSVPQCCVQPYPQNYVSPSPQNGVKQGPPPPELLQTRKKHIQRTKLYRLKSPMFEKDCCNVPPGVPTNSNSTNRNETPKNQHECCCQRKCCY